MDEPIGFWVRQVANDGAVIAVKALAHEPANQPLCFTSPQHALDAAQQGAPPPALD